jgi:hypothetical protein
MAWCTNIGPNHRVFINGVEIAVSHSVGLRVISHCKIEIITPSGRLVANKPPKDLDET